MAGVLDLADTLVLVTSPAIDGARSASATLHWLEHHGHEDLAARAVVVVNAARGERSDGGVWRGERCTSTVDLDQLCRVFAQRARAVVVVPFDEHLAEGAEIDLDLLAESTRIALLELAAVLADGFTTR